MRNSVYICLVICLLAVGATAQNQPFEIFSKAVAKQRAGFAGDKEKLSIVFNQERNRLGENFETELWKYLDNDVEKHYWVGLFLQSGTKPESKNTSRAATSFGFLTKPSGLSRKSSFLR